MGRRWAARFSIRQPLRTRRKHFVSPWLRRKQRLTPLLYHIFRHLVGGLEHEFYDFPFSWECHFIPTDELHHFSEGRAQHGSTTSQTCVHWLLEIEIWDADPNDIKMKRLGREERLLAMDQYLLIPFLGGWTSIYQLFWGSPGVQGFDTLPLWTGSVEQYVSKFWLSQRVGWPNANR